jgi:hypothetical protein
MDSFLVLGITVLLAATLYLWTPKIPKGIPKGPRRLPIIGNVLALGLDPPTSLQKIAKK